MTADDEIAQRQHRLQPLRHRFICDETVFAKILGRKPPQHGPIINVEHDPASRSPDVPRRTHTGRKYTGRGKMRAVDEQGARRLEPRDVKILLAQRHVGAVLAVENERESLAIADTQDDQGSQSLCIVQNTANVDTFPDELFADEAPHVIGADARQQTGVESQSSGGHGRVCRASADILGK